MTALGREKGMRRLTALVCSVCAIVACRTMAKSSPIEDCHPFGQVAPEGTPLTLPVVAPGVQQGSAVLIGYVADSTSGRGVRLAAVLLVSFDKRDSVAASSDSTGRFTIDGVRPGRYRYIVRSVNFQQRRDSLDVRPGIDTLRVVLARGPPLCSVRLD
jgi:hypothetical protein